MGKHKVVEKNNRKKKKKGRPSLLDLQKRNLKQQQQEQQQQNPQLKSKNTKFQNPKPNHSSTLRRSTRRNPNPNPNFDVEELFSTKRKEKKLKLLDKLPDEDDEVHFEEDNSGSDSNPYDDQSSGSDPKKRKIGSIADGSSPADDKKGEKHDASTNQANDQQGSKLDDVDGPSTPLPDQKLLLFILDRLQKKDTYGVFAEPVDPEELPDYHEIIEHPMDFSTIREKLANGSYANLEQFEKDVFLICSNAMQYNSSDTIYFRQARSIQELAKKSFENLRQDGDANEQEPEHKVVRRGRPPTKNLKRPPGGPPLQRANSDFSQATPPKTGVNSNGSNIDTRKGTPLPQKCGSADLFVQSFYDSRYGETYIGWSAERYQKTDDVTGSALKGILMKHGKKQIVLDENRRNTYQQTYALACRQESSVLTTFDRERKQLIGVGLYAEYGYARSLARFAAKLGPVAWKVAAKKIQRCLPAGVKFGPGWIGENEAPTERSIPSHFPAASGQASKSSSHVQYDPSSPTNRTEEANGHKSAKNPTGEQLSETHRSTAQSQQKSYDKSDKGPSSSPSSAGNETTKVSSPLVLPNNGAGASLIAPDNASTISNPNTTFNMNNIA